MLEGRLYLVGVGISLEYPSSGTVVFPFLSQEVAGKEIVKRPEKFPI